MRGGPAGHRVNDSLTEFELELAQLEGAEIVGIVEVEPPRRAHVEEILTELTLARRLREPPVGGGDQAYVHRTRCPRPHRALERAQQLRLQVERQLADLADALRPDPRAVLAAGVAQLHPVSAERKAHVLARHRRIAQAQVGARPRANDEGGRSTRAVVPASGP